MTRSVRCSRWLLASVVWGCNRHPVPPPPLPAPSAAITPRVSPWPALLIRAQRAAEAGRYADTDRMLTEFGVSHPSSAEGAESDFFRALYKADPANSAAGIREQLASLDTYLAGGQALARHNEVLVLRRLVEAVDSARVQVVAIRESAAARDRARDEQVRKLTEEMEKTAAELERIRRRLAK